MFFTQEDSDAESTVREEEKKHIARAETLIETAAAGEGY